MKLLRYISVISVVLLITIKLTTCTEDDYESDYEIDDISSSDGLSLNGSLPINGTIDDYEDDYDEDEDEDECTVDAFIDHYSELLLPEDYEEGKKLDFMQKSFTLHESIERLTRLNQYQQNVTKKIEPIIKRIAPRLSEMLFYIDLPSDCMASLARIGQAAKDGERWAMKFMDSMPSGKIMSLQINSLPFGEYDECLGIESPDTNETDKPKIHGHYCSLGLPTNLFPPADADHNEDNRIFEEMYAKKLKEQFNSSDPHDADQKLLREQIQDKSDGRFIYNILRYIEYLGPDKIRLPPGLCLPSTCKPKDVEFAINKILFPMTRFNVIINPDCDFIDKPVVVDTYQIVSIVSLALMTVICVICSVIYQLRQQLNKNSSAEGQVVSRMSRITDCFSIVPNFKYIFDCSNRFEKFSALDGIRAILCFWMFVQHQYESGFLPFHTKKARLSAPYKFNSDLRYIFFINWNLIDTFFLMGGFMSCYILLTKLDKNGGKFDYIRYAIYRYFRMLPIILAAIAITFVFELFGDGPLWQMVSYILQKPCVENPLPTIFMVNNYVSWPDIVMCVPISWYSSADFQLYLMAPLIILVLYYWPIAGVVWNIIAIVLGSFIALAPKLLFEIPHLFESYKNLNFETIAKTLTHQYWGIESHVQLYVVGILLGYIIRRHPNLYLGGRWGELVIWLSTWALTFYAIFWHKNYFNLAQYKVTQPEIINWIAFSKLCYASGWCWAFYACTTGRAGYINKFFSWKGFKPFAYLMLEIYMLHLFIIIYRIGTTREHVFYTDYYVWTVLVFDYILTCILAIIVNVLITKPFTNLLDLYIKTNRKELLQENNDLKVSANGKLGAEDMKNEIIVLKNVAFDDNLELKDKELSNDTYVHNLDNNNNSLNNSDKETVLKM